MKKFILVILATLLLCGCNQANQFVYRCEDDTNIYVRRFEFDGHRYIEFARVAPGYDNYTGFVHDPDCECMFDCD